ncbi:MAG: hypothetical protein ACI9UA_001143, partial [Pseudoalteromonas tetraodonis]
FSPIWEGAAAVEINEMQYPAASWLLTHGHPYDTGLGGDLNGDGVTLRLAYALNLDPNSNNRRSLPAPIIDSGTLGLNFFAASAGITYSVEKSTDLLNWVTEGVSLSDLDPDGRLTATVDRSLSSQCYLRLIVGN